ncbi:hypothetical protein COU75_00735 [Candidatus Peregrinibacteria bacterium CG10_big_fil_rev_8_21_14_0_10_42_8]|nr:MAG: hypothetical protein COU75_00735 [Candidatus Peregrinibacteria bacterium CG10_big_fil_rev_8_21_14_0_10_42_8]
MHVIALFLALFIPTTFAYPPEVPLFEHTEFRNEYGMFRWYEGCWFRIRHNYAYIICSPNGRPVDRVPLSAIPELVASGLLPADSVTGQLLDRSLKQQNTRSRFGISRVTAAPGDGTRLSDLFRGTSSTRSGTNVPNISGNGFSFGGSNTDGTSNTFRFSDTGNDNSSGFDGYSNVNRFAPRDNNGAAFRFQNGASNSGNSRFQDGTAGGNGEGVLGRPFLEGCSSINDSNDGGILGPIPCTTYPGVLGPIPKYW